MGWTSPQEPKKEVSMQTVWGKRQTLGLLQPPQVQNGKFQQGLVTTQFERVIETSVYMQET